MNILKTTSNAAFGVLGMLAVFAVQSIGIVLNEFVILIVFRWLYCLVASKTFSIWWPVHGAFFLMVLSVSFLFIGMLSKLNDGIEGELAKIPIKAVIAGTVVFLLQFVWHGIHCFFSSDEFLISDPAWLGDILFGVIVGVIWGVFCLIKYPFARKG